jgi:hypothetical protein
MRDPTDAGFGEGIGDVAAQAISRRRDMVDLLLEWGDENPKIETELKTALVLYATG